MLPILGMSQANSNGEVPIGGNTSSEKQTFEINRNAQYNLEEIKVRWKKAALENCPGVPCVTVTVPGSPTNVTAVAGNIEATVSFTVPSSTGGSAITGYTVTSTPVGGTGTGTGSPITVYGLSNGTSYTFTVIATNAEGSSLASAASTAVIPVPPPACGAVTSVTIEGYSYPTVSIGTQCWTKENLKVTKYNDGTAITLNNTYTSGTVSTVWQGLTTGAYTIYGNESSGGMNVTNYGNLYNWYAATGIITIGGSPTKNICPTGWHVPTDTEWTTLTDYLGGTSVAGGKMKSTSTLWNVASTPTPGTNTSDFSALPGGVRQSGGSFVGIRDYTYFWSTTENNGSYGRSRSLFSSYDGVDRSDYADKALGAYIRCLKD